jgi:hypothetical protein
MLAWNRHEIWYLKVQKLYIFKSAAVINLLYNKYYLISRS